MLTRALQSGLKRACLPKSASAPKPAILSRRSISLLVGSHNHKSTLQTRELRNWISCSTAHPRQLLVHRNERRSKSGKAQAQAPHNEVENEKPLLGDEPPLFDGKPIFWARWAFVLVGLDILFIGFSVDMVMTRWTERAEQSPSTAASQSEAEPEQQFVLRPIWQRLGLSAFEVVVGIAAAALILASRDRTVWRIRVRRVPLTKLPPGAPGMRPPPASHTSARTINVMSLESGSGRTKRYLMRDCTLSPGRDLSELFLSINGIRGNFVVGMDGARVLGASTKDAMESPTLKELALAKDAKDLDAFSAPVPGAKDMDLETESLGELKKGLARAWLAVGGTVALPSRSAQAQGWTDGPLGERN